MPRPRNRRPLFSRLSRDGRGATAVEYALILAAVALAIAAGLGRVSTALSDVLTTVSTNLLVGR